MSRHLRNLTRQIYWLTASCVCSIPGLWQGLPLNVVTYVGWRWLWGQWCFCEMGQKTLRTEPRSGLIQPGRITQSKGSRLERRIGPTLLTSRCSRSRTSTAQRNLHWYPDQYRLARPKNKKTQETRNKQKKGDWLDLNQCLVAHNLQRGQKWLARDGSR
jgi:hypothetical protein